MPKSKNKRKSGSGKKGTQRNKEVVRRMESDYQKRVDAERKFLLSLGY